jgi:hypothetical protein
MPVVKGYFAWVYEEFRSSGVRELRSSGVEEFRSSDITFY